MAAACSPAKEKGRKRGSHVAVTHVQLDRCLAERIFMALSWSDWDEHRLVSKEPSVRERIIIRQQKLLVAGGIAGRALKSVDGAVLPFRALTVFVLRSLYERNLLPSPAPGAPIELRLKISIDGRTLRGNSNVGWFLSFPDMIVGSQRPREHHTFALANVKETILAEPSVWAEIGLAEDMTWLIHNWLDIDGRVLRVTPFICADWNALGYIMGFRKANTTIASAEVCEWCHVTKYHLKEGWLKDECFKRWNIVTKSVRNFPTLNAWDFRYCAMHGCNRLLDNYLRMLQVIGSKTAIARVVQKVCKKWGKGALTPIQTRLFYQRRLHQEIPPLLACVKKRYQVPQRGAATREMTAPQLATVVLEAIHTYRVCAYTRPPQLPDFGRLQEAQAVLLAAAYVLQQPQTSTIHYMTSHFVTLTEHDGSAYHTVQEGAEHHHQNDRELCKNVFPHIFGANSHHSALQQLLDMQQLRRIMLDRGHQPAKKSREEADPSLSAVDMP